MRQKKRKVLSRKKRSTRRIRPTKRRFFDAIRIPWKPILGILATVVFVTAWLRYDPAGWFRLQTIAIAGPTEHLSTDDIRGMVTPTIGIPLMALDLEPVRQHVEDNQWVRSVALRRLLPGTLYVHVQEHQPAAIVALAESYLVSDEGVLIKTVAAEDSKDLPTISGLKKEKIDSLGAGTQQRIDDSLTIIHALNATGMLEPFGLSEVHWKDGRILSLTTQRHPFQILLGAAPWQEKLERLIHVLPHIVRNGKYPTRISLDQNEGVIVRYTQLSKGKL